MALSTGLVAWWKLDEQSGTRVDSVGSNDLTDTNTVTYDTGKVGNAGQFTRATSEYLNIADNADLSVGDIDFTFAGWVYFDSVASNRVILSKAVSGAIEYGIWTEGAGGSEYIRFIKGVGAVNVVVDASAPVPPSTGTWYFVVVWHDSVDNEIAIQIDNGTIYTTATDTGVSDGGAAFQIGGYSDIGEHMDGRVDEVGFWKKVLTVAERKRLYNGGDGVTYPFSWETLAGPFVATGTVAKAATRALAGPLVLTGTAVKKPEKSFAGPVTFAGTIVKKAKKALAGAITFTGALAKYLKWILFAGFRDYFLTAPQKFAISSNKVQMTARYKDYYLTAPEKK